MTKLFYFNNNKTFTTLTCFVLIISLDLLLSLSGCQSFYDSVDGLIGQIYMDVYDGDISNVEIDIDSSERYSEEDIEDAMNVVKEYFKDEYGGCTLHKLSYDEEASMRIEKDWQKDNNTKENLLLLKSEFKVGKFGYANLGPNHEHSYMWWMVKRNGQWEIDSAGY